MRLVYAFAAALFVAAPALAEPPKPAVVIQTQPLSRLLADYRTMIRQAAGPIEAGRLVKDFENSLKEMLGEQGFEGIDLNRPLGAYSILRDKPEGTTLVLVVPVTGEKQFLSLLERLKIKSEAVKEQKGLYKCRTDKFINLFPVNHVRFIEGGWAFVGMFGEEVADAKAIVPQADLFDKSDPSLMSLRLFPGRVPEKLLKYLLDELDQSAAGIKGFAAAGAPKNLAKLTAVILEEGPKLIRRYGETGLKEAAEIGLRFGWDPATGDTTTELTLIPKAGAPLAKTIAALPATTNRFANFVPKDAVAGLVVKAPLFAPELRSIVTAALEAGQAELKSTDLPNSFHPVADELAKQLIASVKKGELDAGVALVGPDKDNKLTLVMGLTLAETAGLEKALRLAAKPADLAKYFQFDIAKVGDVSIHKVPTGQALPRGLPNLSDALEKIFGKDSSSHVAFAKDAAFLTFGPDSLARIKSAIEAKPGPAPAIEATGNMNRVHKLLGAAAGENVAAEFAKHVGTDDKAVSMFRVTVDGGAKLSVKATVNVRYLPKFFLVAWLVEVEPVPPPVK